MTAAAKLQAVPPPQEPPSSAPHVFQAIAAVMADLAREGIAKDHNNQQQGYKFRGIDDVYNALAPVLAKHNLVMLPRVISRDLVERSNQRGTALFYVTVQCEFTLASANDGSTYTVVTYGEAMDSGDKATNKAMSAAYKYAAMQAFCIPTEGDNDADASTHEVKAKDAPAETPKPVTLADRAARLEATLKEVQTLADLEKAWKLGDGLRKELDQKDPDRLADLEARHQQREMELSQ